jgi:putative SOS response-associated peptidase YedK
VCGRFVSTSTPEQIAAYFGASFEGDALAPSYNVAPTNDIYAVVRDQGETRSVRAFHWGLVPMWAKDTKIGSSMINARAETLSEKPSFKGLLRKRRCIIPIDGFYEWQAAVAGAPLSPKGKPIKRPMFIHRVNGEPLAVAGLWSIWRDKAGPPDGAWLHSCTIITTSANATMLPVHERMPVILGAESWGEWLDPANDDPDTLKLLLRPAPDDVLTMHAVSTQVNNVRNKGPELIERCAS